MPSSADGREMKKEKVLSERLRGSFEVPSKAAHIFRDYVLDLYFPAHRLSVWQRLRCTPLLFFVEYLVYRVDRVAESTRTVGLEVPDNEKYMTLHRYKEKFQALLRMMRCHNEAVAEQLDMGERYVRLENKVTSNGVATQEEVLQLAELRPSDVRLMHGMIFALLRRRIDVDLLDLLWPVEVLADIANDLAHYDRDVDTGQFNTYDAFVRLYGREAPQRLRTQIARYEKLFLAELAKFPADRRAELEVLCTRRYRPQTEVIPEPRLHDSSRPARLEGPS